MAVDPAAQEILDGMAARGGAPAYTMTPEELRERSKRMPVTPGPEVHSVEDREIQGTEAQVPIRIYRPDDQDGHPVVMMIHGGGFVFGSIDSVDGIARRACNELSAVVVSTDYRLAPENPYPAAVKDCFATLNWIGENAKDIGGDPSRIAIIGESSGGNLTSAVSLVSRDRNGPEIALQVLVVPLLDDDFDRPSWTEQADYPPRQGDMEFFFNSYLGEEDRDKKYARPALLEDLAGLPPALVITAEHDPCRDSGEAYAEQMRKSGVEVEQVRFDGMIHLFFLLSGRLEKGNEAFLLAMDRMRKAFGED